MLKTKTLKVLVTLGLMLLVVFAFNMNTVNATSLSSEELQARLDILPDELTLDITEMENEKGAIEIEKQIKAIWNENNMDMSDVIVEFFGGELYSEEDFYKGIVRLENSQGMEKTIKLVYNNTTSKDSTIEETIKNMKIESPKYHEMDLKEFKEIQGNNDILKVAEKYYKNIIKDDTITVKVSSPSGGGGLLDAGMQVRVALFKNGNLYDIKNMGTEIIIPTINVPETVAEENMNNYIADVIQNHISGSEYNEKVVYVKPGNSIAETYVDIANIEGAYTVRLRYESAEEGNGEYSNLIIVKRTKAATITTENTETNIKLETEEGIVPSNVVLEVAPVTEGTVYNTVKKALSNMKQFKVFAINLLSNGVKIQPNGKVKITIPVPAEFNKANLVVYRVEEDGTKTEYSVTVNGETATFETDHFSTYVLAEKTVTDREKDDTPKTGTIDSIYFILPIAVIPLFGIIAFRKKTK